MYIYEMHQHTFPCSLCGKIGPQETVAQIQARGYAGVVLTNHFYHGNTGIDRSLPWEEFVAAYEQDYLAAKAEGERLGIDVLFGLEEGLGDGKEVLIYGVSPAVFAQHPEIRDLEGEPLLALLATITREAGGRLYQAHPFRVRGYIPAPDEELNEQYLDGVEGYNAGNGEGEDDKAVAMAERKHLPVIAGSDAHGSVNQERFFGIAVDHPIPSDRELIRVLQEQDYRIFRNDTLPL
jgi:hypothetical protein